MGPGMYCSAYNVLTSACAVLSVKMMKNPILKSIYLIDIVMTSNSQIVKNWYKIFIHINTTMLLLFYLNLIFYF